MPTHEESPEFWRLFDDLTEEQKQRFRGAVRRFVTDLRRGSFRRGLRVKGIALWPGMFEMTWAPDGRAVFSYGEPIEEGEPHIIWHAVGTHDVLP